MPNVMAKADTTVRHIGKLGVNPKSSHHKRKIIFLLFLFLFFLLYLYEQMDVS